MDYKYIGYDEIKRMLWESKSDKITEEEREWLDKISTKSRLKFSEVANLMAIMKKNFGPSD